MPLLAVRILYLADRNTDSVMSESGSSSTSRTVFLTVLISDVFLGAPALCSLCPFPWERFLGWWRKVFIYLTLKNSRPADADSSFFVMPGNVCDSGHQLSY